MDDMEKFLTARITLEEAEQCIESNLITAVEAYVGNGYYLKRIRDERLYETAGHKNFEDYVQAKYHKDKGWASKCIRVSEQLSQGGNSPFLDTRYQGYSTYKLVELAYMTEEQRELAVPEMTVNQLKEIRKPEKVETEEVVTSQLSAFGTPKMVRPKDSLITTPGCEGGHDCFSCHMECGIRQKYCYCVEAPMGNPFPCSILEQMGDLKKDLGERCQFVNHDLAYRRSGDQEPVPCCKKCQEPCRYACERSMKEEVVQEPAIAQESEMQEEDEELCPPNNYGCRRQEWGSDGESQKRGKEECRKCWADAMKQQTVVERVEELPVVAEEAVFEPDDIEPETVINTDYTEVQESVVESLEHEEQSEEEYNLEYVLHQQKSKLDRLLWAVKGKKQSEADNEIIECQKVIVYALENLKAPANTEPSKEPESVEQPDLPLLKNNDQRATFVDAYETWPLWIETVETGERYYRYDLPDGTSMVVKVYHAMLFRFIAGAERWEDQYREGYGKEEYYLLQDGKFFRDCDTNRSALIDKLKEIQKGKKDEKT